MNTNYIVALYGGGRRMLNDKSPSHRKPSHRNRYSPLKSYVKKHCDFIKTNPKGIDQITFVFNKSDNPDEDKIIDYTKNLSLNIPHLVIVRENLNLSYGAWGEGLKQTAKDFEYSFLIEDDYTPVKNDFLDYFKSEIKDNSIFVASYFSIKNAQNVPHASISNGLIINKHINLENPLHHPPKTKNRDHYHHAAQNQILFLKQYQDKGLIINDISKVAYTIYKHYKEYTNYPKQPKGNPLLITPFDYAPKS